MKKTSAAHATPPARTAKRKKLVKANMITCAVASYEEGTAVHAV
eukprot:CAMPEP_0119502774 /NCGR_PEP_ID=MMETSP1344-20130328/24143_1 /TAXON_ID=236787 /ORGANISM="Florenciella parvula, Strain CCMP2471" /LENGTH=43 /DNA_ID= /DNA_START= /DNA_END= /DNA_ORIENTATION=